ncbi:MAG: hypothetical protein P1U68_13165 [Verrucomicrobiales bacterium]|nr:hypothetical protein [Verrucomicrobiales bacterium]
MNKSIFSILGLGFATFCLPETGSAIDYQEEIRPILNDKCFKCHSGPRAKGKLRMDSEDNFADRIGGNDPVIIPGDAATSLLAIKAGLPREDGDAMPPPPARARGAEPMTAVELNLVKQWIALGAKFEAGEVKATEAAPAEPAMTNEVHSWTNFEGNTIKASFIRLDGSNVVIKMENGQEIPYALDKLSAESQSLAKKLSGQ